MFHLDEYQLDAVNNMHNGSILAGGTGSGKSIVSLAYYFKEQGGKITGNTYEYLKDKPKDLFIITTAAKRNKFEWDKEMIPFCLTTKDAKTYDHNCTVDSWNNIKKYKDIKNAFFIFDEQRAIGSGTWAKSFIHIARNNQWIMLSATPGDNWSDYEAVFIANGFYDTFGQFRREHIIYDPYVDFPKINGYLNEAKLRKYKAQLIVNMDYRNPAVQHHEYLTMPYDRVEYKTLWKDRWDPETNEPIENISKLCYLLRKSVNTSPLRMLEVEERAIDHPRMIIFYNFDYELEILRRLEYPDGTVIAEYNGHKHEPVPDTERWIYLVQYNSGSEGWNCTDTDTMIFYSQNYSYKMMVQAAGRIDRRNTQFKDLYYYHMVSQSPIDKAIQRALKNKKKFNETRFVKKG